ncbi:MAG: hypothetical protein ACR2KL_10360 [Nocardioidaceae bacterium]
MSEAVGPLDVSVDVGAVGLGSVVVEDVGVDAVVVVEESARVVLEPQPTRVATKIAALADGGMRLRADVVCMRPM